VVFHRGWFPQVLPPDPIRYRFAHVDMDTYQSTIAALDYLLPRMVPGGVVVFDDYGWFKCQGVQQALHEIFPPERIHRVSDYQAAVRF
jgi:O-methyltransferase